MSHDFTNYLYPEDHGDILRSGLSRDEQKYPDRAGMQWTPYDPEEINGVTLHAFKTTFLLPRARRDRHRGLPLLVRCKITPFYCDWYKTFAYRYEVKLYHNAFFTGGCKFSTVIEGSHPSNADLDAVKADVDLTIDWAYDDYLKDLDGRDVGTKETRAESYSYHRDLNKMRTDKYRAKYNLPLPWWQSNPAGKSPDVAPVDEDDIPTLPFEAEVWPDYLPKTDAGIRSLTNDQLPKIITLNACTKERVNKKIRDHRKALAQSPDVEHVMTHPWSLDGIQLTDPQEALQYGLIEFFKEMGAERHERMLHVTGGADKAVVLEPISHKLDYTVWNKLEKFAPIGTLWVLPLTHQDGTVFEHTVMLKYTWIKMGRPKNTYRSSDALKEVLVEDLCPKETAEEAHFVGELIQCSFCGSTSYHCGCD